MAVGSLYNESENNKTGTKQDGVAKQNNGTTINKPNTSESTMSSRTGKSTKAKQSPKENRKMGPKAVAVPPDGGWGWMIVFASFMVSFILDGVCFTFGFFFNDFQTYFGASKSTTSLISSCLNGTYMITGPIASALVNIFGCRKVASVGAVMTSISFLLCTISPNVEVMILLYGVCGGIGFGLMYLPAIVMVGYYFDKRRALATGIAVCGSGVGGFLFAPLCETLINAYHWKGSMWIISAICLNGIVLAFLFRPLAAEQVSPPETDEEKGAIKAHFLLEPVNPIYRCKSLDIYNASHNYDCNFELSRLGHSLFLDVEPRSRKHALGRKAVVQGPLDRKDVLYTGSVQNLPEYKMADTQEDFVRSMLSLDESASTDSRSEFSLQIIKQLFADSFDLSLLKSLTFVIYIASCFLCMMGFFVPFIYIPAVALEQDMTLAETTWIISTIGIINTIGRVFVGYISDKPWCDAILVNVVSLVIAGTATLFVPYYHMYALLILYGVVFGFSIAAFVSLRSIIIVDLLGIDKLTNSFGIVVLCQGLSTFIGAPIAGALSDATGNYVASFYLAGTVIILSGLICLPLRRIKRWETERALRKEGRKDAESRPMLTVK